MSNTLINHFFFFLLWQSCKHCVYLGKKLSIRKKLSFLLRKKIVNNCFQKRSTKPWLSPHNYYAINKVFTKTSKLLFLEFYLRTLSEIAQNITLLTVALLELLFMLSFENVFVYTPLYASMSQLFLYCKNTIYTGSPYIYIVGTGIGNE